MADDLPLPTLEDRWGFVHDRMLTSDAKKLNGIPEAHYVMKMMFYMGATAGMTNIQVAMKNTMKAEELFEIIDMMLRDAITKTARVIETERP